MSSRKVAVLSGFRFRKPTGAQGRSLYCEEVLVSEIARQYGTPIYVYSGSAIADRVSSFQQAFRAVSSTICYSVKANSNVSILKLLARVGCGFDVVSGGELERVLRASRGAAKKVVFSGVGKTAEEIRLAVESGILLFNVESRSELETLAECATRAKRPVNVAFRVNPDVPAKTHPYISTGLQEHKFGVAVSEARSLYQLAAKHKMLNVAGVSVHIGSQITDVKPFQVSMLRIAQVVRDLRNDGHAIRYVDAGGGLGISYDHLQRGDFKHQLRRYAEALIEPLKKLKVHLLLEPGRAIIAEAGALVTQLIYTKMNGRKKFYIVDAAMNDLIRPSLYNAHHEIVAVEKRAGTLAEKADVVGPICESGDFFARDRQLPNLQEGDLLAILDAGAYGMSLASNYNSRGRAAEVLVAGRKMKLIRRRENLDDLLATEILERA